jgi:Flp pilus assembly protein TadD
VALPPIMWLRGVLACVVALVYLSASAQGDDRPGITQDRLLGGALFNLPQEPPALVADDEVLAVSPEMQAFLEKHVSRNVDQATRLRQLSAAIVSSGGLGLRYDETTRTASEAFRTKHGNCLSFSSMFVALARQLNLKVRFQEVDTPPDWSLKKDAFVLNRHVNVLVDLGGGGQPLELLGSRVRTGLREGERVIDFNIDNFKASYDRRVISDERALAHFDNNLAVERMQAGDVSSAFLYFRKAVGHDPGFTPAWTNLGILYLREGHPEYSEGAYLQALKTDERDLVAMSNLASLYERAGEKKLAAQYRDKVIDHRLHNPYYRFLLAREAFEARDYETAIGNLRYAIHQKGNEDQFYYQLGLCYLKKGDEKTARRWLTRAEEVAATETLKRRYADEIKELLPSPPREHGP